MGGTLVPACFATISRQGSFCIVGIVTAGCRNGPAAGAPEAAAIQTIQIRRPAKYARYEGPPRIPSWSRVDANACLFPSSYAPEQGGEQVVAATRRGADRGAIPARARIAQLRHL